MNLIMIKKARLMYCIFWNKFINLLLLIDHPNIKNITNVINK